jgi:hypothetical protein
MGRIYHVFCLTHHKTIAVIVRHHLRRLKWPTQG